MEMLRTQVHHRDVGVPLDNLIEDYLRLYVDCIEAKQDAEAPGQTQDDNLLNFFLYTNTLKRIQDHIEEINQTVNDWYREQLPELN